MASITTISVIAEARNWPPVFVFLTPPAAGTNGLPPPPLLLFLSSRQNIAPHHSQFFFSFRHFSRQFRSVSFVFFSKALESTGINGRWKWWRRSFLSVCQQCYSLVKKLYALFFFWFSTLFFIFVRVGVGLFLVRTSYAFVEGRHYCLVHCLGEAKRKRKNYCNFFHTVLRDIKLKHNYVFSLRDSNLYWVLYF